MNKLATLVLVATFAATLAAPLAAVAAPNEVMMPDHSMRVSKIIGAPVYNDGGQNIGSVVDVLVKDGVADPTAILSVGDYIGGGTKLVAVPLSHVNLTGAKAMMPATKQSLISMPVFLFPPNPNSGG